MDQEHGGEVRGEDAGGAQAGGLTPAQALALVQGQCAELLNEAARYRGVQHPDLAASPHDVHAALVQYRAGLDRLEGLLVQAVTLKDSVGSLALKYEQAAEDAWDDLAKKNRGRGAEYEGAQERYAVWRVQTRAQREAARLYREAAELASSAEHRIRVMHRGMDGARLDLHRRLTALAFEDSISRPG